MRQVSELNALLNGYITLLMRSIPTLQSTKKGQVGIADNGVITNFTGTAVHDCWGSYWRIENICHAVCCAHLLRELIAASENNPSHIWAKRLGNLLLTMKSAKEKAIERNQIS